MAEQGAIAVMEVTSETRNVLIVFVEQHAEHPPWRDQTDESSIRVDDGDRSLSVFDCLPRGRLLDLVGRHHGWIDVHDRAEQIGGVDREHVLDPSEPHQAIAVNHRDVGHAVEAAGRDEGRADVTDRGIQRAMGTQDVASCAAVPFWVTATAASGEFVPGVTRTADPDQSSAAQPLDEPSPLVPEVNDSPAGVGPWRRHDRGGGR